MAIVNLDASNYEELLMPEEGPVIVDFWRHDCSTCKSLGEELEALAAERPEIKIFKVCVDEQPEIVKRFRVMMAPSLMIVKKGVMQKKSLGFKSKAHIIEMFEEFL